MPFPHSMKEFRHKDHSLLPSPYPFCSLLFFLLALNLFPGPSWSQSKPSAQTFEVLSKQAAEARDANRLDEAISLYKNALALRPNWPEGWWSLGTLEYDRNNYSAASQAFRRLLPLAPKDGTAHAMLGLCEFELGEDAAALKHIEEAKAIGISTNPQLRIVVLYHNGVLLLRANRFLAAQEAFASLCQDSIPSNDIVNDLGLAVFRLSPKLAPPADTPGAAVIQRVGHAACLTAQKKYDEAHKEYSDLVAEYPGYPNIHYVFGKFFVESGNAFAGVEEFQKELKNNPEDINSRLEIAAAQYKVDSAAGIPYAQEVIRINPRIPFAHYLLGLLYLDIDDYQKAIPELEVAQKALPKDAKVQFALSSAYSRAGRKQDAEKARAAFQRLKKESPEESQATY